jgi:hypothetical protein
MREEAAEALGGQDGLNAHLAQALIRSLCNRDRPDLHVRAIALHCTEGPLKSRPNNDEFQHSSRSHVTSTFRANSEAP